MPADTSMFAREQAPFTITAALLMSLQPILVTMSKNPAGGFSYSVPSSTMLSELLKLVISMALLVQQCMAGKVSSILHEDSLTEFASYIIPSFIYFINNNCIFFILQAVDPTTFQLLSQMKTIFTGLLFRIFLKRRLSAVQYLALLTLACGTACSQLPSGNGGGSKWHKSAAAMHAGMAAPLIGGLLSVFSSLLSALGGIYNEKLLKGRPSTSIHWQNIQMYVWGVVFNALGAYMKDGAQMSANGLLSGFSAAAWTVVVCNALNGLAISAVLKCASHRERPAAKPASPARSHAAPSHRSQVRGQYCARVRACDCDDAHHGGLDAALPCADHTAARPRCHARRDVDAAVQPAKGAAARRRRCAGEARAD